MNTLSTHVLDTSLGRPASGVRISLERVGVADQITVATGVTDANGRVADLAGSECADRGDLSSAL